MPTQIEALITLLDDDSPSVLDAVTERLLELGDSALPALRNAASGSLPRVRSRARGLVTQVLRPVRMEELVHLLECPDTESPEKIESASIALCRVHSPDLCSTALTGILAELADMLRLALDQVDDERQKLELFLTGVHSQLSFSVTSRNWSFDDHFLHTVVERRRGLPLSIAVIYSVLGQRVGIDFSIVGAPMRTLALTRVNGEVIYVSPYDGGQLWDRRTAERSLVRQGLVGVDFNRFLPELTTRQVIQRGVRNVVNYCDDIGQVEMKTLFQELNGALNRMGSSDDALKQADATE